MTDSLVTLAILAGGKGSRMGGPKDGLYVGGQPILLHLLRQLSHAGPTLLVTSPERPRPTGWEAFDHVTVDSVSGVGPLAGIASALGQATTPLLIVLSIDMPWVSTEQVDCLVGQFGRLAETGRHPLALLMRRQDGDTHFLEPLPSLYHRSSLSLVQQRLAMSSQLGKRSPHSLQSLAEEPGVVVLDAPADWPPRTWLNLNRPHDLQAQAGEIVEIRWHSSR